MQMIAFPAAKVAVDGAMLFLSEKAQRQVRSWGKWGSGVSVDWTQLH